jgi:hypothetical protein
MKSRNDETLHWYLMVMAVKLNNPSGIFPVNRMANQEMKVTTPWTASNT